MIEELCSHELRDQARAIIDRTPLVKKKTKVAGVAPDGRKITFTPTTDPWEGWLTHPSWYSGTDMSLLPGLDGRNKIWRKKNTPERSAWIWMGENDRRIIDGFVRLRWGGDLRHAMEVSGNEDALHNSWLEFFSERRKAFMEQEQALINVQREAMGKRGRPPSSHGGVANLLKVLTKTMQESGASILSIAKMQYSVCVQAGIMLPNEFLTDVLVGDQIANGLPPTAEVK